VWEDDGMMEGLALGWGIVWSWVSFPLEIRFFGWSLSRRVAYKFLSALEV
jgi:hypothetical protein